MCASIEARIWAMGHTLICRKEEAEWYWAKRASYLTYFEEPEHPLMTVPDVRNQSTDSQK
jgi:hypothetical protein